MRRFCTKSSTFRQHFDISVGYTIKHMRVLEPKQIKPHKPRAKRKVYKKAFTAVILIVVVAGIVYALTKRQALQTTATNNQNSSDIAEPVESSESIALKPFKKLSGDGFKELYQSVAYPNTQEIIDPPVITGDSAADARIRSRAEARGYHLSRIPMGAIVKIKDETRLDSDDLLQPLAAEAWYKIKQAGKSEGYPLTLISAYRSPEYQRAMFIQRIYVSGVTLAQLASGSADATIDSILQITAVPGYSRHHTGYTVDFWCEDGSVTFLTSSCYRWLSADGYQKAMEFGWIPSYPEGASEQGPEPEPWEYVWVGSAVRQL